LLNKSPKIALLIVSNADNTALEAMLLNTISSALYSTKGSSTKIDLTVYCSEKQQLTVGAIGKLKEYNVKLIEQNSPFNYNGEMNRMVELARKECNPDYFILANSDLDFNLGSIDVMINKMKEYNLLSASPFDPHAHGIYRGMLPNGTIHIGYSITKLVAGWCIFCEKSLFDKIGKISEDVTFWYSDNIYADQLKKANISHGLITSSIVEHFGSKTLSEKSIEDAKEITEGEKAKYFCAAKKINIEPTLTNSYKEDRATPKSHFFNLITLLTFPSMTPFSKKIHKNIMYAYKDCLSANLFTLPLILKTYSSFNRRIFKEVWWKLYNYLPKEFSNQKKMIRMYLFILR